MDPGSAVQLLIELYADLGQPKEKAVAGLPFFHLFFMVFAQRIRLYLQLCHRHCCKGSLGC